MYGIGFCGLKHPHVFDLLEMAKKNRDVAVIGAFEDDKLYAQKAAGEFECFFETYEQMLSDPRIHIVAIGDAYGKRGKEAVAALLAGKHILSDKPLCTKQEELMSIRKICKEKQLFVGCMLDLRYDSSLRLASELISKGEIGTIHAVNFTGQHPLNFGVRSDWYYDKELHGGTFNDLIIHGIDAVDYITGLKGLKVHCARNFNAFAYEVPHFLDCAQMIGEYENGAGLTADVSYSAPADVAFKLPSYWRFSFWGSRGMIECKLASGCVLIAKEHEQVQIMKANEINEDCLSDLIKMIRGEYCFFDQESVFRSTQTSLMIQNCADGYAV